MLKTTVSELQKLIASSPEAMIIVDSKGKIIRPNKALEKLFGYKTRELMDADLDSLLPECFRKKHVKHRAQYFSKAAIRPMSPDLDLYGCRKDGTEFPVQITLHPFKTEDGTLVYAVVRDMSEFKRAQELLTAAIEGTPEGFAYFDKDDRLAVVNKRFIQFYPMVEDVIKIGTPYEVVLRTGIERGQFIIPQGHQEEFFKERLAHHRDPKGAVEFILPDDRCIRVEERKLPSGGIVGIRTDITELKRAEEERLRQYQKMEVLGQLTSSVAHDFNNVLTVLECNINLLKSQNSAKKRQHSLINDCMEAIEMGSGLASRLTDFVRREPTAQTRIDLNALIAGFSNLLDISVSKDISIKFILPGHALRVLADAALVEVALLNLVVNARDAMPKGGKITVSLNETNIDEADDPSHSKNNQQPYALLQVSDTGVGMPAKIKERVFEAFFTTKDEGKGTGLGLNTVQDLARSTGGFVEIESELGQGTVVKIFLPLYEEELS
jgi:PAS domain S-box-containing protein